MYVVLIVSEERALRASIRTILEGEYLILEASSTPDAGKTLVSQMVDLVLLDAPQGRSKLLYCINRIWEVKPTTPIVILSELSDQGWTDEVLDYGVFDILPKPFGKAPLLAAVKRATKAKAGSRAGQNDAPGGRNYPSGRPVEADSGGKGTISALVARIQPLFRALTRMKQLDETAQRMVEGTAELFGASSSVLLLDENDTFEYKAAASWGVLVADTESLKLGPKSELVRKAMGERAILVRRDQSFNDREETLGLIREMDLLGAQVVVPLWRKGVLFALLCLGNRITGIPYGSDDIEALGSLSLPIQKALENALEFREVSTKGRDYQVIVQDLGSGVITTDQNGRVTAINQKAETILGIDASAYTGKPVQKLSSRIADMLLRTLEQRETFSRHEFRYGKDNMLLGASSSLLRNVSGDVVGAVLTFTDITETRKSETRKIEDLKLAEILNLSAWLAHQVKNPLVGIKTFTEMLPVKFTDKEFREKFTEIVGNEVQRLDSVITKLVRLGGDLRLKSRPTAMHKLTDQLMTDLGDSLKLRKVQIEPAEGAIGVVDLECDAGLLRDALYQLFSRVVRSAGESTKLELSAEIRHAQGDTEAGGEPREFLELRLYDPKHQAVRSGRVESLFDSYEEGTPDYDLLGMAIARKIIRAHNGWVEEGRPELGETDIRIALPCKPEKQGQKSGQQA